MKRQLIPSLLITLLLFPVQSIAAPIILSFSGEIRTANILTDDPFDGRITEGSRFVGGLIYDSTPTSSYRFDDQSGYVSSGLPYGFFLTIEGLLGTSTGFSSELLYRVIAESPGQDAIDIQTGDFRLAGEDAYLAQIFLGDSTRMAVTSLDLPLRAPDLNDFDIADFFLGFGDSSSPSAVFVGSMDRLTTVYARVPEPASFALLAFGFLLLMLIRVNRVCQALADKPFSDRRSLVYQVGVYFRP